MGLFENIGVSCEQLESVPKEQYVLVDMRDEDAAEYGMLPSALLIPAGELEARAQELPKDRAVILYCARGLISEAYAERLRESGIEAYHLEGGYAAWVLSDVPKQQEGEKSKAQEVEESIRKQYRKKLFTPFAKGINAYDMIQPNDKIAVCISGGKDSMIMAKLFQELKRHNKFPFEVVFMVMDPGYSPENRKLIEQNAKMLNIPITVFESDIFDAVYDIESSPCYLCARMRRGHLYSHAKALGCNKIALGHHYDDVIETILMGMLYGGQVQTMMPKLHSTNFEGMELIRPMYLVREADIKRFRDEHGLHFLQCACRFTDTCSILPDAGESGSNTSHKRMEIKHLIAELKKTNPFIEGNIFRSVENVNLSTVIAYKKDGVKHWFTDNY